MVISSYDAIYECLPLLFIGLLMNRKPNGASVDRLKDLISIVAQRFSFV